MGLQLLIEFKIRMLNFIRHYGYFGLILMSAIQAFMSPQKY